MDRVWRDDDKVIHGRRFLLLDPTASPNLLNHIRFLGVSVLSSGRARARAVRACPYRSLGGRGRQLSTGIFHGEKQEVLILYVRGRPRGHIAAVLELYGDI